MKNLDFQALLPGSVSVQTILDALLEDAIDLFECAVLRPGDTFVFKDLIPAAVWRKLYSQNRQKLGKMWRNDYVLKHPDRVVPEGDQIQKAQKYRVLGEKNDSAD